ERASTDVAEVCLEAHRSSAIPAGVHLLPADAQRLTKADVEVVMVGAARIEAPGSLLINDFGDARAPFRIGADHVQPTVIVVVVKRDNSLLFHRLAELGLAQLSLRPLIPQRVSEQRLPLVDLLDLPKGLVYGQWHSAYSCWTTQHTVGKEAGIGLLRSDANAYSL